MPYKFNPLTGKLDYYETSITKKELVSTILVESNETLELPKAEILFDDDSILYNDDEAI